MTIPTTPASTVTIPADDYNQSRTESTIPSLYRLARKDGTLVLQGCYQWTQGLNCYGYEWRDIPTVIEP